MSNETDPTREQFEYFSNEYAQALQAFEAIRAQAATIMALGGGEELRTFVDQFITLASTTREQAIERGEQNFADWFGELIQKAHAIRNDLSAAN